MVAQADDAEPLEPLDPQAAKRILRNLHFIVMPFGWLIAAAVGFQGYLRGWDRLGVRIPRHSVGYALVLTALFGLGVIIYWEIAVRRIIRRMSNRP